MSLLPAIRHGLRALFRGDEVDRELDDEVRHYLAEATEENIRAGMTRAAAERAARLAFGAVEGAKEGVRGSGWEATVETLWRDLRYALRGLRRNPGYTAVAAVTLALGIGATTAMFSVVNAVMLRPLPYRDASRLAMIWTDDVQRGLHREATASRTITDWQRETRSFAEVAYFSTQRTAVIGRDPAAGRERTRGALVSANLFPVLGVSAARGRVISTDDESQRAPVAVISHSLWQRRFAGADDVVGRTLATVDASRGEANTLTIVGVMPPGFYFPDKQTELWTPATTYWRFSRESSEWFPSWARRWTAVARLRDGVSLADARSDLARIGAQLAAAHAPVPDFPGFATTVIPILDVIAGERLQSALWMLLGAVVLVLLVACANVANLLLARGATRQREFAIRRAIGAGRGRLVRQVLVESAVLAGLGGALGTLLAAWSTRGLSSAAAAYVPRIDEVALDARVLAVAFAASLAAGLMFGLVPALRMSATDAGDALKEGARGGVGVRLRRSRSALVLAECAVAMVLLAGAGLLIRSLMHVSLVDPGFDPARVLTVRIELPPEPPPSSADERPQTSAGAQTRARAHEAVVNDLLDRIQAMPGVESAGFVDDLFATGDANSSITIPGRESAPTGELNDGSVSAGFFPSLRVPLKRGRYLSRDDGFQKIRALWSPVATNQSLAEKERLAVAEPVVVNEAFVRRFFPDADPIGRKFCIDPTSKTYWYEIVGVIGNMHRQGPERPVVPEYFGPYIPSPNGRVDLLVRVADDPLSIAPTVRSLVSNAVPGAIIPSVSTAESQFGDFSAQRRFQTWLLAAFAALALVLAAIGIYGVVRYSVAERTHEIGVRLALGASQADVLALVVRQGIVMPAIGITIGLALSVGVTRIMAHLLFGVGAADPLTFAGVGLVLALVAAAACYFPARRAARVDPVQALRLE
jgi:putative ABC transport system permease protein